MNVNKIVAAFHASIQAEKECKEVLAKGVNWSDPESQRPYYQKQDASRKADLALRDSYKDVIKTWCSDRGVDVNVRSEMRQSSYPGWRIEWGDTSVWNDKDTVRSVGTRKIGNWTNKVTVMSNGHIRTNKIRTDAAMLGKFAEDLAAFVKEVIETVNKEIHGQN
jgi:hypothetical protein